MAIAGLRGSCSVAATFTEPPTPRPPAGVVAYAAAAGSAAQRPPAARLGLAAAPLPLQRHLGQRQQHPQHPQQQHLPPPALGLGGSALPPRRRRSVAPHSYASGGYDPLVNLGTDFLTFLVATVLVVPVFKSAKQSPVLGYLFAGLVLGQLG